MPAKMTHPSLDTLPNELLSEICAYLCPHCSSYLDPFRITYTVTTQGQKDLLSLSKTSKRLRSIASPFLFHVLFTTGDDNLHRHLGMIRRMHERPDLAAQVQYADFNAYSWVGEAQLAADIEFAIDDLVADLALWDVIPAKWIIPADGGRARRSIEEDDWIDNWEEQQRLRQEFTVELPLSLAPNLECLHVEITEDDWVPGESRLPPFELLALERLYLSNRRINGYPDSSTLHLGRVGGLIDRAPNLRLLSMAMCETVPPGLSLENVTVLDLLKPQLEDQDAANLFAALKNLQALRYTIDTEVTPTELTPRQLVGAMHPAGRTLRYLQIIWDSELDVLEDDVITSMTAFTVLETLVIGACCIYSDEADGETIAAQSESQLVAVLPPSLKSLSLWRFAKDALPDVLRFAAAPQLTLFPNLREFNTILSSRFDALTDAFSDTGVRYRESGSSRALSFPGTDDLLRGDFRFRPFELTSDL